MASATTLAILMALAANAVFVHAFPQGVKTPEGVDQRSGQPPIKKGDSPSDAQRPGYSQPPQQLDYRQYPGYGQPYPGYGPPVPYGGYPGYAPGYAGYAPGYAPPQYPGGYNPYAGFNPYGPPQQPPKVYHGSKESEESEDWKKTDTNRQLDYGLFGLKMGDVQHERHTTSEGTATHTSFKQSY